MTPEEWIKLTDMFKEVYDKIDALPCKTHGELISRMQGVKNGENSIKQAVVQQKTLSYKIVGIIVGLIMMVFKVADIIIARI